MQKGAAATRAIPAKTPEAAAWSWLLPSAPGNAGPEDTGGPFLQDMNEKAHSLHSPHPGNAGGRPQKEKESSRGSSVPCLL